MCKTEGVRLAVFDLDGTLSRTDLFSVPAHIRTMNEMGYPVKTEEEVKRTFGMVQKDFLNALIGDYTSEKAMEYVRRVSQLEGELIKTEGKPYDGTREMLAQLQNLGIKTAVCSNASYRYISMVINSYGLFELIDYIQPVSEGLSKVDTLGILLEHVKPEKAVMAGDTGYDMQAAKGNNIPFVACMYGFRPEQLADCECKAYDMVQLTENIKKILG